MPGEYFRRRSLTPEAEEDVLYERAEAGGEVGTTSSLLQRAAPLTWNREQPVPPPPPPPLWQQPSSPLPLSQSSPSRKRSDGALAASAALLGAANALGSDRPGDATRSDEDVDEVMLTRTLQQLARRQRTLAALREQLAQAEHMRHETAERERSAAAANGEAARASAPASGRFGTSPANSTSVSV